MKRLLAGLHRPFPLAVCSLLAAALSICKPATCQDLSSPRFFNFNIQSLSSGTSPLIPISALSELGHREVRPSFLYEFELRFPIKMNGKTQLFGEIGHKNEYFSGIYFYERGEEQELEALELFQTSGSLILLHQFSERWKLINVLRAHSDSNKAFDFGQRALGFNNVLMLEKKIRKGTLGFGGLVSFNQRITLLPVLKYKAGLGKKWGLDILLPSRALVTRDFSKRTSLFFGLRGDAATYFLNGSSGLDGSLADSNFRRISINGIVGIERQLSPMVGFRAEVGASMPYRYGVFDYDQANLGLHDFQNRVSPHFRVGVFLSLPR